MSGLQSGTIIAHMHTESKMAATNACGFTKNLNKPYKAIIQIACKNAE